MEGVNAALMGVVQLLTDPPRTCSAARCASPAVMWFETAQSTERFYSCDRHIGAFAQSVAMASAYGLKVV